MELFSTDLEKQLSNLAERWKEAHYHPDKVDEYTNIKPNGWIVGEFEEVYEKLIKIPIDIPMTEFARFMGEDVAYRILSKVGRCGECYEYVDEAVSLAHEYMMTFEEYAYSSEPPRGILICAKCLRKALVMLGEI